MKMRTGFVVTAAIFCILSGCRDRTENSLNACGIARTSISGADVELRLNEKPESPGFGALELVGLGHSTLTALNKRGLSRSDWQKIFPVQTGTAVSKDTSVKAAMLGNYVIEPDLIRFTPRFPFVPGLQYVAGFDSRKLKEHLGLDIEPVDLDFSFQGFGANNMPATFVEKIYPSAARLPENLLKMYVYFSGPIGFGNVHDHIRLLNANDEAVPLPFVEVEQGLWGPHRKRLTLFLHPGRIKRNVGPNLAMGPVLQAGENYQLVVDRALRDDAGAPLAADFTKRFIVLPADRQEIAYQDWRVERPLAGTRDPLLVYFGEPLDHALLERCILVCAQSGTPVSGEISIADAEQRMLFKPQQAWVPGEYVIRVKASLEDLAGNRIGRLFDVATNTGRQTKTTPPEVRIEFHIPARPTS